MAALNLLSDLKDHCGWTVEHQAAVACKDRFLTSSTIAVSNLATLSIVMTCSSTRGRTARCLNVLQQDAELRPACPGDNLLAACRGGLAVPAA